MVKIRLQRKGTKARPFYRLVVTKSTSGRDGAFAEILGTYNPVPREKHINVKNERALYWLMNGAEPTETAAVLLKKAGVLDEFFKARPNQKAKYKFLDKRVAAQSAKSVIEQPAPAPVAAKEEAAPVEAAPAEEVAAVEEAAPAAEEAKTE